MKKLNILKKNEDFSRIIKNNKAIRTKSFIIYIEYNTNDIYHFGISVSKKIINAVGRNKIKRQIKEIISTKIYQNNFNCIIIVKKDFLNQTFQSNKLELENIFKRLNIVKGEKYEQEKNN